MVFVHFFEEFLDFPLNLNIRGINTDNITNTEPPRSLISGMLCFKGISFFIMLYDTKVIANNIVKYSFFPIIPQIIGEFEIFI